MFPLPRATFLGGQGVNLRGMEVGILVASVRKLTVWTDVMGTFL
jgi:hypothetical protein